MSNNPLPAPETIITGHLNADSDALASMVAARMFYPNSVIIAPTYRKKIGANYFLDSLGEIFAFKQLKDIDISKIRTLVVVDTRQRDRIAHVAAVLKNPDLIIHCYDHHPDSEDDLPAKLSIVKPWGSTTTILTHLLKEKGIIPSRDESTMMGLGIYEDTGSFTFDSTTEYDFTAAAWLRNNFMDLSIISDLMSNTLTSEQVLLLHRMIESAITLDVHGISIMITNIVLDDFVDEFAVLTHQLFEMEKDAKVILALAQMGDRVQIVARSRVPEKVDVGAICNAFGGGGHSYAAAASVKDKTLEEVKAKLSAMLFSAINKEINVGSKMTAPAKVVEDTQTLATAEAVMLRYGLKACPVVFAGTHKCAGIIEYQIAARAVVHKLGNQPVSDFMRSQAITLSPSSDLYPAMEIILDQRQRMIPVVDDAGDIIGVLTRTDIMHLLLDESLHIPEGNPIISNQKNRDLTSMLKDKLPGQHYKLLQTIGELADNLKVHAFAVGGFVRDLLMDTVNLDIDITVEGDGMAFAKSLSEKLAGKYRAYPAFQTALVIYNDSEGKEQHIDVATARLEYYEYPGALPTVELSSIKMDLSRRDFTINALAISLNSGIFGLLVDPYGALRDLHEKHIRVLHSLSFIEDPTRILRAIRFEKRFNFKFGQQTEKLMKNCLQLGFLQKLSGSRLFNEICHIFAEKEVLSCLERMENLGIMRQIHPLLGITPAKVTTIAEVSAVLSWYKLFFLKQQPVNWMVYLLALCPNAKYSDMSEVLQRFNVTEKQKNEFMSLREATRTAIKELQIWQKNSEKSMSFLYNILIHIPLEGILYLMAQSSMQSMKKEISNFLSRLWNMSLDINGDDLLVLGVPQGPQIGMILKHVLDAKADGIAETKEDQLEIARVMINKLKNSLV
jgi:tRNA nucleotidyltransferase (CCA-adding enzyme)